MSTPPTLTRLQASFMLLAVAFIWGTTFIAMKTAFSTVVDGRPAIGVLTLVGVRFLLGSLVVLPFALRERTARAAQQPLRPPMIGLFILLGCVLGTASFFQQLGVSGTTVTNAGFLTSLYVPLVPLIAFFFFRQKIKAVIWFGVLGCALGSCFLTGVLPDGLDDMNAGDVWVLVSTIFWALHVLGLGFLAIRSGRPVALAVVQSVVAGVLGVCLGLAFEDPFLEGVLAVWPQILYAGVLSVGVAYTLQGVAQRVVSAPATAVILSTEMVFAAAAGAVILHERLLATQWVGAVLILGCLLLVELSAARENRNAAPRA